MRLPSVSSNKILEALNAFDKKHRNTPQFTGWENYERQKYAISYEGKLYPPKVIISLATGVPRSDFSGGWESNSYLSKLGFKIIKLSDGSEVRMNERDHRWQHKKEVIAKTRTMKRTAEVIKEREPSILTAEIYALISRLPRYNYLTDARFLPNNGIYFFFEKGENRIGSGERLVRVGTHRGQDRLRKRLNYHFKGTRDTSVFRKHIGGAIISKQGLGEKRLRNWHSNEGRPDTEMEEKVSLTLQDNFSFTCLEVNNVVERLSLEEGLIALFASDMEETPSSCWLGHYAANQRIRQSGLWNSEHVDGKPLTVKQLQQFKELVDGGKSKNEVNRRSLVLIPCCKSKAAILSEGWEEPLPGLPSLREQLIEKLEKTSGLASQDANLEGVLNSYATVTRAVDLYCGNFYYAAGDALKAVAGGGVYSVDILIVSAVYGLVQLNEGIKKYELQMGDTLHDGSKAYKFWQQNGLWKLLWNYAVDHNIGHVWSLLPNSMPSFPYQQTFKDFWSLSRKKGIECYHVRVPGAATATGYQRARWLNEIINSNPDLLTNSKLMPNKFENIAGYKFVYDPC